ncbi:MAG: hydroxysqualene dehydroxylase HpnE [Planctomycetaceae bacterium]|jgi:squalene-associated FAD-dependent desaturase
MTGDGSAGDRDILVVGGGLAGLACAAALGARGWGVTLLESRNRLGGRASSFRDAQTGEWLDNCQHVSLGCCTNFSRFCQMVGIADLFHREDELIFIGPEGTRHVFAASALPAPLHLAPAFARLSYLSWSDRWYLSQGLRALAGTPSGRLEGLPFDRWLADHHQPPRVIELFWHVVLVSALSETVDRLDAAHARKVFVDAFLTHRAGWEVWLPTVPLERLYGEELLGWLAGHGVTVRLNAGVRTVASGPEGLQVTLRDGNTCRASRVVLAVPSHLVPDLAPDLAPLWSAAEGPGQIETAPISSVHLWYDREITPDRHVTFVGQTSQWLFNRERIQGRPVGQAESAIERIEKQGPSGWYGQVVISASHQAAARPAQETIDTVTGELARLLPGARDARLLRARMVTEHRAVIAVLPGADRHRPGVRTDVPGLYLAGDWVQTGWPSTMEGAVRSGWLAAEAVLEDAGSAERLLTGDLPVSRLSKWLLRL